MDHYYVVHLLCNKNYCTYTRARIRERVRASDLGKQRAADANKSLHDAMQNLSNELPCVRRSKASQPPHGCGCG